MICKNYEFGRNEKMVSMFYLLIINKKHFRQKPNLFMESEA